MSNYQKRHHVFILPDSKQSLCVVATSCQLITNTLFIQEKIVSFFLIFALTTK